MTWRAALLAVPFTAVNICSSQPLVCCTTLKLLILCRAQPSGDLLWQLGDKAPPNDGFTAARIFPTQAAIAAAEAAAAAGAAAGGGEGDEGGSGAADAAGEAAEQLGSLQLGGGGSSAEAEGGEAAAAAVGGAGGALDMDALLEAAVLAGLQALKNADLPIQAGDFYTKFMVPAKPEGEQNGRRLGDERRVLSIAAPGSCGAGRAALARAPHQFLPAYVSLMFTACLCVASPLALPAGVMLDIKASKYKKLSKLLDKFEKDKVRRGGGHGLVAAGRQVGCMRGQTCRQVACMARPHCDERTCTAPVAHAGVVQGRALWSAPAVLRARPRSPKRSSLNFERLQVITQKVVRKQDW